MTTRKAVVKKDATASGILAADPKRIREWVKVLPTEKRSAMSKALKAACQHLRDTKANYSQAFDLATAMLENFWHLGIELKTLRREGVLVAGNPSVVKNRPGDNCISLKDIGVNLSQSSRSQMLAELKRGQLKKWIKDQYDEAGYRLPTLTGMHREQKEAKREKRRAANRRQIAKATAAGKSLPAGIGFAVIALDPPWDWGDEGDQDQLGRARPTYGTMSIDEVTQYEPFKDGRGVGDFADEDCHLYLWITNRSLPKGFGLLDAWGFRYVTCLTWCKPSIGMGNYFRGSTEHVLFGVKGSQPLKRKNAGTWFAAQRGKQHSEKPEEFYELVESCSPGPYLELFARAQRGGDWTCLGAEANDE
jgi:N6-adenosine-specific RNA methylase IME4